MNGMQPKVPVYDIPKVSHEGKVSLYGVKSLHGFSHRSGVYRFVIGNSTSTPIRVTKIVRSFAIFSAN